MGSNRLRQAMTAFGLLVMVAGCAPAATPGASTQPSAAGPQGKVVVGVAAPTYTALDPGLATLPGTLSSMMPAYDGLVVRAEDGQIKPALASSWRSVDERTWEYTLGDWTFHNGRAVTIDDVLATFRRYRDPANKLVAGTLFNSVESIDAVGKTIVVRQKQTDPTFGTLVGYAMILPMKELEEQTAAEFFKKPIGTGPYRALAADVQGLIRYEAMGAEFKTPRGTPKLKEIEIQVIPDATTRTAALKTGVIDLLSGVPLPSVKSLETEGFTVASSPASSTLSYLFETRTGPTANLKVRQALNYAIDRETLIRVIYNGQAEVDSQLLGPSALGFNPDIKPWPYDPAKAKQLLAEAGYANGFSIDMTHILLSAGGKDVAEYVASQLRDVGVTVNIGIKEIAIWTAENNNDQKNVGLWVQTLNWDHVFEAQGVYRWFGADYTRDTGRRWDDPEFARIYEQAKTTFDLEQRRKLYLQAAVRLNAEAPVLFLVRPNGLTATKKGLNRPSGPLSNRYYVDMSWG